MIDFEYTGFMASDSAYQTQHSAAFDIWANESLTMAPGQICLISTGLKISNVKFPEDPNLIPFAEIRPRSGLTKDGIIAHLGTIDPDYRGEIKVILENRTPNVFRVSSGDRIAQMVIQLAHRSPSIRVVDKVRGESGFGSTGV